MFEILKHLRDINTLRPIDWHMDDGVLQVAIPLSDEDVQFVRDMQTFFAETDEI